MSKKNYTLSLNKESTENLRTWLKPQGIKFSSYIALVIDNQMAAIRQVMSEQKNAYASPSALLRVAGHMAEEIEKDVKSKSKKTHK